MKSFSKVGFLIIALAGIFFLLFHHVFLLGSLPVELCALVLVGCGILIYLFIHREARFPRTGLEVPLACGAAAVILSLVFSPDPRLGMEKAAWLVGFVVLFYFLLDAFDRGGIVTFQ